MLRRIVLLSLGSWLAGCAAAALHDVDGPDGGDPVPRPGTGPGQGAGNAGGSTGGAPAGGAGRPGGSGTPSGGTGGARGGGSTGTGTGGNAGAGAPAGSGGAPVAIPPSGALTPAGKAHPTDFAFDDSKLRTWTLTVTPSVMAAVQAGLQELKDKSNGFDAIAARFDQTYYPAVLKVDDEMYGKVTFRHKGSYGTLIACLRQNCKKLSYKIKFDDIDTKDVEERFHGLKKINLHSQIADQSHLHERLAYSLFREMGVLVPRSVHGRVMVNGEYKGLFGVTEAPDSRFVDRLFVKGAGNGNLYKEAWPSEFDAAFWKSHRETNEDDPMATDAKAMAMSTAIRMASAQDLPKVMGSWLDMDYVFRWWAVDRVINNWDGPVTFYCGGSVTDTRLCRNHNFFLYEQEGANRFWIIPWDLDNTFQLRSRQEDVGPWDKAIDNCASVAVLYSLDAGTKLKPAQCDTVFKGLKSAGTGPYAAALKAFLEGPFQVEKMRKALDTWSAQISPAVMADTFGPGFTNWMSNFTRFRTDLATLRDRFRPLAGL